MQAANMSSGFNHNLRSFEILKKYEKRYPEFDGLNLTEEVLVGVLKHKTDYDEAGDVAEYEDKGPTLEAKVVDIADALAYLSHDVDDGLTSGCITEDDLMESEFWKSAYERVKAISGTHNKEMLKYQIVKALIDIQMRDLLSFSEQNLKKLNFKSSEEVKEYYIKNPDASIIGFSPSLKTQRDDLQNLLNVKLYHHYRVVRMTDKAKRVIHNLFEVYLNNPKQLPYSVYQRDAQYGEKEKYEVICNHIASMTDRFALDEHKKLFNPYQKV
jgi:dGTPase